MATRQIKDLKDLDTGELIYARGHAKATYMSDGRNVEEAISQIDTGGGGSTLTEDDIADMGFTKNVGTITSVAGAVPDAEGKISAVLLYNNLKNGQYSSLLGPSVTSTLQAGYIYVVDYLVTRFTINGFSSTSSRLVEEYSVHFKTSSSGSSISLPSQVKWAGEKPNTLSPDTYYELNIVKTRISGTDYFKAVLTPFV